MADTEKGGNGVSREQADPRPERPDNVSGPCVSAPRNHETHRSLRRQLARHLQARLATGSLGATCDSCTSSLPSSTGAPPPSPLLLESELLLLSLATGIQDATTFPDYACFASNQTGNTVLFAVGAAGLARDAFELANIAMSLGVFVAGCVLSGQAGNYLVGKRGRPSRRRWWVLASNAVSTALVVAAVAVQWVEQLRKQREHAEMGTPMHGVSAVGVIDVDRTGPAALGVIALLAFASAMQVTIARPLGVPQITTVSASK